MSFPARAQATAARLVGHFGGGFTVTVRRKTITHNVNTGAVTSDSVTDYTYPAVVKGIRESDWNDTLMQTGDRMLVIDTSVNPITISDDDDLVVDSKVLKIREVLPLMPGDTLATMRLVVEGF